ncbi:hypothetical protein AB0469_26430 [Streptomyces sp. NPDC093801]|uniref:hypothetical protein n=1 Tax=Streptomyces sp. NPDC093801 TaxID=3155203 RepID=UPI00344FFD52
MTIVALGALGAYATASADSLATPRADEPQMPSAVEDFAYPNADQILASQGIKLVRGDGKITLADCDNNLKQIRVYSYAEGNRKPIYCFTANSNTGQLSLELARVFAIDSGSRALSADLTAEGVTKTVSVAKDSYASVGEGVIGGARSVLVEIRVTG